jgi:hypothetical protein
VCIFATSTLSSIDLRPEEIAERRKKKTARIDDEISLSRLPPSPAVQPQPASPSCRRRRSPIQSLRRPQGATTRLSGNLLRGLASVDRRSLSLRATAMIGSLRRAVARNMKPLQRTERLLLQLLKTTRFTMNRGNSVEAGDGSTSYCR